MQGREPGLALVKHDCENREGSPMESEDDWLGLGLELELAKTIRLVLKSCISA